MIFHNKISHNRIVKSIALYFAVLSVVPLMMFASEAAFAGQVQGGGGAGIGSPVSCDDGPRWSTCFGATWRYYETTSNDVLIPCGLYNKRRFGANGSKLLPLVPKWRLLCLLVSVVLAIVVLPCIATAKVSAASITLTVPTTLKLTLSADGQLHSADSANISVLTDAYKGYTFKIKSQDGQNALTGASGTLPSMTGAAAADIPVNHWGYAIYKAGAAPSNYEPGPTADKTVEATTAANSAANNYKVRLGAKVNGTVAAGTYSHNFVLTITANDVPYNITYNGEGVSIAAKTGNAAEGSTVQLAAAPSRNGYNFMGWCSVNTTTDACTGQTYAGGANYTIQNNANTVALYAMWKSAAPTTMDSFNSTYCTNSMTTNQMTTLTDSRDGNTYRVRKLADGKCWMIDNLRLGDSKLTNRTLTTANSDVGSNFTLPASTTSGFSNYDTSYVYMDNTYGGYYSWFAATAGEGTQSKSSGEVSHSICPNGWRLPTKDEFVALDKALGGTGSNGSRNSSYLTDTNGPSFVLSGSYRSSSSSGQGSGGLYWSSTAHSTSDAYYLGFNSSYVDPTGYYYKSSGFAVRCVAR